MKTCIFSAIAGALAMLLILMAAARISTGRNREAQKYEHTDYVSSISKEACFVCGETPAVFHWGEDNVGIVDLNTFEVLYLEINRYDEQGALMEAPAGYMISSRLAGGKTGGYAHAFSCPDQGYAKALITGVQYAIDRDAVQDRLCQDCLDSINSLWFGDQPPAEYAIVSFEDRTIQVLLNNRRWFSAGNFGIDCEFTEEGEIDLLIHYAPNRYQ